MLLLRYCPSIFRSLDLISVIRLESEKVGTEVQSVGSLGWTVLNELSQVEEFEWTGEGIVHPTKGG